MPVMGKLVEIDALEDLTLRRQPPQTDALDVEQLTGGGGEMAQGFVQVLAGKTASRQLANAPCRSREFEDGRKGGNTGSSCHAQ
jgi:hypothetical protein